MRFQLLQYSVYSKVLRPDSYRRFFHKYLWRVVIASSVCMMLGFPLSAFAQLRFAWPDTTVNMTRYRTVEECLAATDRIYSQIVKTAYRDVDMDTMPLVTPERVTKNPPLVRDVARQCSAQFIANTFVLTDGWNLLLRLYWQSERFGDMNVIASRRLSEIAATDSVQYAAALDTMVVAYQTVYPRPLTMIDSLLETRKRFPAVKPANADGFTLNARQLEYARIAGDTILAQRAAERIKQMNLTLPKADRRLLEYSQYVRPLIFAALDYLAYHDALDSLKRGTQAFVSLKTTTWAASNGGVLDNTKFPVGQRAAVIPPDFVWENHTESPIRSAMNQKAEYPRQGRPSLVIFYGHECYQGFFIGLPVGKAKVPCAQSFAALKRLALRFPELDIVVVTETHGYFSYLNPLTPDEEADWLRQWHHAFHHLPGTLIVTKIPFWRLPDPDRRRIDEMLPHVTSYAFGKTREGKDWVVPTTAFLLSKEGTILHTERLATPWTKLSEQVFTDLLTVLFPSSNNRRAYGP